ncbi:MAG: hypothetical protein IM568_11305 [Flavobacterium sp.]|nr:hypothetical protein [Flavobacterium sp.]
MKNILKYYIIVFIIVSDFAMYAQPGDDDGGGGLEGNDPQPAPINGKLVILAITAILFVLYTYRNKKRAV